MDKQVTVAIIEDHPVVTEGVASWIRSDPGQRVLLVQTAPDLTQFGEVPQRLADVIILDLELSGELVTAQIPGLVAAGNRVVAFSGHSDPAIVMETLDHGAHAYLSKEEGRDHLVEAVLAAAADRPYVTRSQARAMLADERPARPSLSQQEQQALLLWFQGMSKAVHQPGQGQVRGHRPDRAEQGRAARPRDRGRRDQAGRDRVVPVIRPLQ
jgi:two-component system, NarL family, nitrate/nitrite response regulator NarL